MKKLVSFTAGGTLTAETSSYVKRSADDELLELASSGQLAYVFAPPHMGKSSLMIHTICRLQQQGIKTAAVDLDDFDVTVDSQQVYLYLLKRLSSQLEISTDPTPWWMERATINAQQRFTEFLHDVILAEIDGKIVIFVDGINDITSQVDFFESFLSAIQAVYEARSTDPIYQRLSFVLLGRAIPETLVKNLDKSPFKLGQPVYLNEFSRAEARLLEQGLQERCSSETGPVFDRIFYWTKGHPYLTQKLCSNVDQTWDEHWNAAQVDSLVERLFTPRPTFIDPHLATLKETIQTHPQRRQLLALYHKIYQGNQVPEKEHSLIYKLLKGIGLVRSENGALKISNQIYYLVFNFEWVEANLPRNPLRYVVIAIVILMLLGIGGVGYTVWQSQRAAQAQVFIETFREANSQEEQLTSLAELFNLTGYEDEAQRLFYDELSLAEQQALFEQVDPIAVGEPLVTVVKGVYTNPILKNSPQSNELLRVMVQALNKLDSSPALGSIELELEITQWLRGREAYTQGQYQQAVEAYNIALTLNNRNPGTYYDRGLAYAALGESSKAFADFSTVLALDEGWQMQVEQSLLNDSQLYTALWNQPDEYRSLIALVPTPEDTPTPTGTATSSPTPTLTSTPTATFAPTNTPTATATPTSTSPIGVGSQSAARPSPTPGVPSGTFTLLKPTLEDNDTYGPTEFEWQWTGSLPPEYGFEVRVWREGEQVAGAHNAVLDNQNGNIKKVGNNTYQFNLDISNAAGVKKKGGIYLWSVAVVQISPEYADVGLQAPPSQLEYIALGGGHSGGGDGGGGGGGGGGVGID